MVPPIMDAGDNELEQMRAFALALLSHNGNSWVAAQEVFMPAVHAAIRADKLWTKDPRFHAIVNEIAGTTGVKIVPTKEDLNNELWAIGKGHIGNVDVKDRLAALKLFAEINDMIPKNGPGVAINNQIGTGVLVVPDHGSPEDWQAKAKLQQRQLIEEARAGRTTH